MGFTNRYFGIGFNIDPYVGWYGKKGGAIEHIPGTAYILGKIFWKIYLKVLEMARQKLM